MGVICNANEGPLGELEFTERCQEDVCVDIEPSREVQARLSPVKHTPVYVPKRPVHHHRTPVYVPPPKHYSLKRYVPVVHHPAPVHVPVLSRHSIVSHPTPVQVHHPAPVHVPVLTTPYTSSFLGHTRLTDSHTNAKVVFEENAMLRRSLGMPAVCYK